MILRINAKVYDGQWDITPDFLQKHYLCRYKIIRTSLENFGKLGKVDIIPLYALSNLYPKTMFKPAN